jgi:hypothetical protein
MKNYCEWCHQADEWSCPNIEVTTKIGHLIHCQKCHREILLVTVSRAARIAGVSNQTIYDWIRKGWVSTVVCAAGRKKVCYSSMYQPPKSATEEDVYVEALSERARNGRPKDYRGRTA